MTLFISEPGIQTTIQAGARRGLRHKGVPISGPADEISAALVNRAAGNRPDAALLEITYGGFAAALDGPLTLAVGGAEADITVNGLKVSPWAPINIGRGRRDIRIGPATKGARVYLAVRGGLKADQFLGSCSTYLPAGFGGYQGRALKAGDELVIAGTDANAEPAAVPASLRPFISEGWSLPALPSAETDWLSSASRARLFGAPFLAGRQMSRMGIELVSDDPLEVREKGLPFSAPVFPGTVQCPGSGHPFILSADAQTTGGYPRIAQIIRADRHRLGQIRPGDQVTLTEVTDAQARKILATKKAALAAFLMSK
ncbi:biotin-dependent carboxyltransferase family protein [Parvularcula marina]|uniref:5-oxoprolinase subunit C family protein n=1 Tax=Parvularcula marina TaxID=2292771 RepID=UPI003511E6C2